MFQVDLHLYHMQKNNFGVFNIQSSHSMNSLHPMIKWKSVTLFSPCVCVRALSVRHTFSLGKWKFQAQR